MTAGGLEIPTTYTPQSKSSIFDGHPPEYKIVFVDTVTVVKSESKVLYEFLVAAEEPMHPLPFRLIVDADAIVKSLGKTRRR